jgi:hypothetical protein
MIAQTGRKKLPSFVHISPSAGVSSYVPENIFFKEEYYYRILLLENIFSKEE